MAIVCVLAVDGHIVATSNSSSNVLLTEPQTNPFGSGQPAEAPAGVPPAPDSILQAAVGALAAQSQSQSQEISVDTNSVLPIAVVAGASEAAPVLPIAPDDQLSDQLDVILKVLGNTRPRLTTPSSTTPFIFNPL